MDVEQFQLNQRTAEKDLEWFFNKKTVSKGQSQQNRTSRQSLKKQLYRINIKADPVIMKITSHTHVKTKGVKAHLNYLSREKVNNETGEVEEYPLYNQYGQEMTEGDKEQFHQDTLLKAKAFSKTKTQRVTSNLMLTKPHLMSSEDFKKIGAEWLKEIFPNNEFVYTYHNDSTEHLHAAIAYFDDRGAPLNPRKTDIQKWRESFADMANEKEVVPIVTALSSHSKGKLKGGYKRNVIAAEEKGIIKKEKTNNEKSQKKQIQSRRNALLRLYYYAKDEEKDAVLASHLQGQLKIFDKNFETGYRVKKKSMEKGSGKFER